MFSALGCWVGYTINSEVSRCPAGLAHPFQLCVSSLGGRECEARVLRSCATNCARCARRPSSTTSACDVTVFAFVVDHKFPEIEMAKRQVSQGARLCATLHSVVASTLPFYPKLPLLLSLFPRSQLRECRAPYQEKKTFERQQNPPFC